MKRLGIITLAVFLLCASGQQGEAKRKNYYRTFEIINITGNGLILQDNDGNVIEVDKGGDDYRVGYKVRYDSVRKRLRPYRWQDYQVKTISGHAITLQHKTGDIISVEGNYLGKYDIGDSVRYDAVAEKLKAAEESGQWKQYKVVAAGSRSITLRNSYGHELVLSLNNDFFPERPTHFMPKYKVGDLVRYNARTKKLKKGVIRTYDWQDYVVLEVSESRIILSSEATEKLILPNRYGTN